MLRAGGSSRRMMEAAGIDFDKYKRIYPTVKAHSLVEAVKEMDHEKSNDLMKILFQKYFQDGENINDMDVLTALAEQVGMGKDEAMKRMTDKAENDKVVQTHNQMRGQGIAGVPCFIFVANKTGKESSRVSGAQPVTVLARKIQEAASV